ncbi:MAG: RagB/SusD family nutrient uptake outer membrane protein [Cyclobacteriaceae bacterium]
MKNYRYNFLLFFLVLTISCTDSLDIQPVSQYSDNFLETSAGVRGLLNSAYDNIQYTQDPGVNRIYLEECVTDVFVNFRGFLNGNLQPYQDFTFNATSAYLLGDFWEKSYRAVRDANTLLGAVEVNQQMSDEQKTLITAEAHFIRGLAYNLLYGWFGPVPLIDQFYTDSNEEFNLPRADQTTLLTFIESELRMASDNLPLTQDEYGRATKGAALGVLTKFYLQMEDWQNAAATAQEVIDLDTYSLWPDFTTLFALENEGNAEMIFAFPAIPMDGNGNVWIANALPPQYPVSIFNTATQVCVPVEFYNTFQENDIRRFLILANYTSNQGEEIDLTTGVEYQNPRSFKYPIDLSADARAGGADFILVRYADILLSRAEALVMGSGSVSQEALDLVNQVRNRAQLPSLTMADVPDQPSFVDMILQERAWEFYSEGKRRDDLRRHYRFTENARNRGKNAQPFHVLFPIPQSEIDANPNLEQNEGY